MDFSGELPVVFFRKLQLARCIVVLQSFVEVNTDMNQRYSVGVSGIRVRWRFRSGLSGLQHPLIGFRPAALPSGKLVGRAAPRSSHASGSFKDKLITGTLRISLQNLTLMLNRPASSAPYRYRTVLPDPWSSRRPACRPPSEGRRSMFQSPGPPVADDRRVPLDGSARVTRSATRSPTTTVNLSLPRENDSTHDPIDVLNPLTLKRTNQHHMPVFVWDADDTVANALKPVACRNFFQRNLLVLKRRTEAVMRCRPTESCCQIWRSPKDGSSQSLSRPNK